jgi:CPA2 family monovalent cation:H+ antiporter-2
MTVAAAFGAAWALGLVARRIGISPIVGYLLAGVLIGPHTPGFVADVTLAPQLAEIGVILLMFGVGLHFSLGALLAVRNIAVPGAVVQIVLATLVGAAMARLWGWSLGAGLILGLALSVASTVVLVKALEERSALDTTNGRIADGWLVVEDLAMIIVLVLLPALAEVLGGHAAGGAHGEPHGLLAALAITIA